MQRSGKDRDFASIARSVVERAIGERLDGTPLENPDAGKNPQAVASGRIGGLKGGLVRASKLSANRRKEIARKAASTRWLKKKLDLE